MNIDTTAQEKAIPTDSKLAIKIINRALKLGRRHETKHRRTYAKEIKDMHLRPVLDCGIFSLSWNRKKAEKAIKRLRTIADILLRDLERKLPPECVECDADDFAFYRRVLAQKRLDKNKIYSLHEPHVYCMKKGKDHKPTEFGTKASVVATAKSNIIVGVLLMRLISMLHITLVVVLEETHKHRQNPVDEAVCNRGVELRR